MYRLHDPFRNAQADTQAHNAKTRDELQKLFAEYSETGTKGDRVALERLFADEYVWIQANRSIRNKKHQVAGVGNTANFFVPTPTFDDFKLYGDVAVTRC